jgi:hypothetical protein
LATSATEAVAGKPFKVSPLGVTVQGKLAGASAQVNVIGPLKPSCGVTVSWKVPVEPGATLWKFVLKLSAKSGPVPLS